MQAIRDFLKGIWAFELLSEEQLSELAHLVNTKKLQEEEVLWLQGQRVTFFSMVYDGKLRSIRQTIKGSEKLVTTLTRGYHFGLAEMITQADSAVTLTAEKPTVLLTMDVKLLRNKLLKHPEICYRLMQTMARTIFSLTQELERASFETVHTRLARLLLSKRLNRLGLPSVKPGEKHISHQELALQIGASRETVSRALSDFKRQGLIDTSYRIIAVLDRPGLLSYIDEGEEGIG